MSISEGIRLEKILEKRLVQEVEKLGGLAWKLVSPSNAGVPDRLVILPGGFSCMVELKKPGKDLSPLQFEIHKKLIKRKYPVYRVDSYEKLIIFTQILKSKL